MFNINKKKLYLEFMLCHKIKFVQLMKRCTNKFPCSVKILMKNLEFTYYNYHICKNAIKDKKI